MELTLEQERIVGCDALSLAVKAFAGAAKTTTLIQYAKARPRQKMIYLAFNKSVATEAQSRFPSNVTALTTHSHAYRAVGYAYRDKLVGALRERDLVQAITGMDYAQAAQVIRTINAFHASPYRSLEQFTEGSKNPTYQAMVQTVWERMCDPRDTRIGMTHDGYLKLAHIKGVTFDPEAILLLDEAQDSSPVTLDMFLGHAGGKVAVGDNHQQIYAFRGATNALAVLGGNATRRILSQSFRTPRTSVEDVNAILSFLGEENPFLGGSHAGQGKIDPSQPYTILARSNAGLFQAAMAAVSEGRSLNFIGGVQNYRFSKIKDAFALSCGSTQEIRDPYLRSFKNWNDLGICAKITADPELEYLVKVVNQYGHRIPEMISMVERRAVDGSAHVTLGTAHKAKGLEWDQVMLWDDFRSPEQVEALYQKKKTTPLNAINEVNLLYVGMTRTRKNLAYNRNDIPEWLAAQRACPSKALFLSQAER